MSAPLTLAAFLALAQNCAPTVAPETLAAVVRAESGFHANSLNINQDGRSIGSHRYRTRAEAEAALNTLLARGIANIDVGIAQINARAGHMQRRGLPITAALDPCTGLRVGGEVLADCFRRAPPGDPQARLRAALACYNTGTHNPSVNYVRLVQASAEEVVPAIHTLGITDPSVIARQAQARRDAIGLAASAPCAPEWDVWRRFTCERQPPPTPAAVPDEAAPVVLNATTKDVPP